MDLNNSFTCFDDSLTVNALAVHHGGTSDRPYISTGFDFPTLGLTYISDAHALPDSTWHFIRRRLSATGNQTQVLIVDCLKVTPSRAHFGLGQALGTAKALNAETTYFTQISDGFSHEQLTDVCKTIAACTDPEDQKPFLEAFQRAQQSTRQIKSRIAHRMLGVADDDLDALRGMALTEAITCGSIGVQNAQPAYDGQVLHLKALNLGSP